MDTLAKQVAKNGVYTAPVDGMITELNFAEGAMTNNSLPLFKLADLGQGFRLIVSIDNDLVDYAKPGDTVSVNILSLGDQKTEGKIDKIVENSQHNGDEKDLWIDVSLEGLTGGEKGEIYLSKKQSLTPLSYLTARFMTTAAAPMSSFWNQEKDLWVRRTICKRWKSMWKTAIMKSPLSQIW